MKEREGKKEGKKEKHRKERREGGGRPTMAWPAATGVGRSWPEKVAQAPSPSNLEGASVVPKGKWSFENEASENEAIARWKEYSKGRKMT